MNYAHYADLYIDQPFLQINNHMCFLVYIAQSSYVYHKIYISMDIAHGDVKLAQTNLYYLYQDKMRSWKDANIIVVKI